MIRAFFRIVFLPAFVLGTGLLIYAGWIEPRTLVIRQVSLGEGSQSVRLALLSDIHIGGLHMPPDRVADIVETVNDQNPDFVVMPGDFINGSTPRDDLSAKKRRAIEKGLANLSALNAPAIATTGNHDSHYGRAAITERLVRSKVAVIDNSAVVRSGLCFVGIADYFTDTPTSEGFAVCRDVQPIIALMHSPDTLRYLSLETDLAVAGHTHGGQVNLPLIGRRVTSTDCGQPCAYGWISDKPPLFVSAGLGTSILPIRFRAPPEIVIITLHYEDER